MSSPASLNRCCLLPRKYLWKLRCDFLTSRALVHCSLWTAALLSASLQVSWEIQDACAFFGRDLIVIPPFDICQICFPIGLGSLCLQLYWPAILPLSVTTVL